MKNIDKNSTAQRLTLPDNNKIKNKYVMLNYILGWLFSDNNPDRHDYNPYENREEHVKYSLPNNI